MSERRVSATAIVLIVVAILLPAIYVAGYFALSKHSPGATAEDRCRMYRLNWQAQIYKPAAKVESAVTGDTVSTYWMP